MPSLPAKMDKDLANILYVDDEENNLVVFAAAFRKSFNVFTALSAKEGMKILQSYPIALVVTDQRMPEMTGVQFLEAIAPEHPEVIRMVLTGFSDIDAIIRAINTGKVFRYITKPWNQEELKIILDTGVKIYQLERANRELLQKLNKEVQQQERIINYFKKYVSEYVVNDILMNENVSAVYQGERVT